VKDQYADAQRNLMFALARSQTGVSSEAARRQGVLGSENEKAVYQASALGQDAEKQARGSVAREKNSIIAQLQATADPGAAASASRSAAEMLSINPPMATIGPMFQNVTAGLAGAMQPRYDSYGRPAGRAYQRGSGSVNRGRIIG
jgi:hypothetical protein